MAPQPKRPFRPGFPVWQLEEDPRVLRLPVAAYGMLYKLSVYFWRTECHDMPTAESELRAIARAHKATWAAHKSDILAILSDYRPVWRKSWASWEARRSILQGVASRGMAASLTRKRERGEEPKRMMLVAPKLAEAPESPSRQGFRDR